MSATASPTFEQLTAGDVVAEREFTLTRDELVRYAGASGDFNPIHYRDDFAQSVGLPGVLAHGMLTMGAAVQLVSDWAGDPAAVVDYQTRFTGMVPVADTTGQTDEHGEPVPGAVLQVRGVVGAVDEAAGTVRIDLDVTVPALEKPRVLTKAQALVRLPAPTGPRAEATSTEGEAA